MPASQRDGAERLSRLDLSDWLFEEDNPLTARVFVNRLWKQFFNEGLSRVLDDLGSQGEPPVHPELLDWLAVEFRESGWDVKHMVELIVTSETYKQSSTPRSDLEDVDPANTLLARQESYRLEAELIRDKRIGSEWIAIEAHWRKKCAAVPARGILGEYQHVRRAGAGYNLDLRRR